MRVALSKEIDLSREPHQIQLKTGISPRKQGRTHNHLICRCQSSRPQVLVVGGGAAGLTAAYFAAKEGAEVLVLEKTPEAGKKILISGGKRCNVLPMDVEIEKDYFTDSSKSALRAIFSQWRLSGCKDWLERDLGLQLSSEAGSLKYFPRSNSAKEVRDCLVKACLKAGAQIRHNSELLDLSTDGQCWACHLEDTSFEAPRVVIAIGGLSFPAMGTDGKGMRLLESRGHTLCKPYPALTPMVGAHVASKQLAGLSLYNASLWCEGSTGGKKRSKRKQLARADRSAMLFTHRGFSGPGVLDLSHHVIRALEQQQDLPEIRVNWTAEEAWVWEERMSTSAPKTILSFLRQSSLPQRLAEALAQEVSATAGRALSETRVADLTKAERAALLQSLVSYPLNCTGHEGYPKAEVTGGGVRLNDIDCASMESRVTPGIFLCGEVLDVFGRIGGFNFYWAWLTGRLAGLGAAKL